AAGRQDRALRHQPWRADRLDAAAEIDADRQDISLRRGLSADPAHVLVQQVLEFRTLALVAGGAPVGDVVGNDLYVELLGHHSGSRGVECAHDCLLAGYAGTSASCWIEFFRRSFCCWRIPATSV